MIELHTPLTKEDIAGLRVGDRVMLYGPVFCGRDAVLPRIVRMAEENRLSENEIRLEGGAVFHTAVSPAGVGPTSSNKLEIESSIAPLSEYGIRIHIGKGQISAETVCALREHDSVYAVIPPVTALLGSKTENIRCIAYPELGMEALYMIEAIGYPLIIAAANGESIYDK